LTRIADCEDNEGLIGITTDNIGRASMDRREFFEQLAVWSAGACVAAPLFNVHAILAAEQRQRTQSLLAIAKGKDYAALVARSLEPLGGMGAFVKKGARVVVKPNIGWDRTPEQAANTHPEVVKAIVQQCLNAGAKQVMVFDRTCNNERHSYASSGIKAAVESIGDDRARCIFQDINRFIPIKIEKAKSIHEFTFYKDALGPECDCYINVPVAKHHSLAKLTLGLKNVMGVIGGKRGEIHKDIHQRLADLNTVIRPQLTIIDATRILLRNGPTGGNLKDVKVLDTLIASADPVAADSYATTLFGMKPEQLGSNVAAAKLGLGEMNLSKVKMVNV
jgi:uncharacterized protein (DUF362 family)